MLVMVLMMVAIAPLPRRAGSLMTASREVVDNQASSHQPPAGNLSQLGKERSMRESIGLVLEICDYRELATQLAA